ncbi:recombination protein NinG, partial [Ancylomarina longa]|uniref:recombination protein NinG n=1 Tax=Ancylomarina longa TaxID=2487017 RepID=UPI003F694642
MCWKFTCVSTAENRLNTIRIARCTRKKMMAKPARRRCKNDECREWFHPAFANQWWCSPECGTKIAP